MATARTGRPVGSERATGPACVVVAGFPSSGKSAVVRALGRRAVAAGRRPAVGALECFPSEPRPGWTTDRRHPVPWRSWTTVDHCPDHALVDLLPEMRAWAARASADLLLVETAGLCCRCSPYPVDARAVFVADASAGRGALAKVGPMLTTCDLCVLTRPDRITPAERDMLVAAARGLGRAAVMTLDGLTGEGADALWTRLASLPGGDGGEANALRAELPEFYCSYCLGRERIGILEL